MQMHILKLFSYTLFFKTIHKTNPYTNIKQDLHTHKILAIQTTEKPNSKSYFTHTQSMEQQL